MIQEDKELLLKDLSARLPYNCRVFYEYVDDLDGKTYGYSLTLNTWCIDEFVANKAVIKPYLLPMDSMTEEEESEYNLIQGLSHLDQHWAANDGKVYRYADAIDWLNSKHFDYRGLIEKGLAIKVTAENNPYK